METFSTWFASATAADGRPGHPPHPWQQRLAEDDQCRDRLIRIPTGLGKTLGVLLAWTYHRLHRQDARWPRRLVWCLPMRTLVDQTAGEARDVLQRLGLSETVDVHRLMGGIDETRWYADPERPAVLVGTQDMLLSRALNRGYAMGRAAWPRAFGLLHNDALWVMDEIQLMGVGLTTSAQLQAFWHTAQRRCQGATPLPPRATWWMSATLQPQWLRSPETEPHLAGWEGQLLSVEPADRDGPLWEATKSVQIHSLPPAQWPAAVLAAHRQHAPDPRCGRQTLVVVNRVKHARELFAAMEKELKATADRPQLRLVHSRFRPFDRADWADQFLSRRSLAPDVNRIIVSTQVVEAGVDLSASCLLSELAPWPSLVQRFGRAGRYGGQAEVHVLDPLPTDDKQAAPYLLDELNAAREALGRLGGVAIKDLDQLESQLRQSAPETLERLYRFAPLHVLLPQDFDELFDTAPDLSGADIDVSRFIREGDGQTDLQVFWRRWEGRRPPETLQPAREELCAVGVGEARAWLAREAKSARGLAWAWDYVDGQWRECRSDDLRPGMVVLVAETVGGYDPALGFTGDKPKKHAPPLDLSERLAPTAEPGSDLADGSDAASESDAGYKTIATHAHEAARCAIELAESLGFPADWTRLIGLALRLHDWGKAHPAFAQGTYRVDPPRFDLAKAPADAWPPLAQLYHPDRNAQEDQRRYGTRPGFRHELASVLATLELLRRCAPHHQALQGSLTQWPDGSWSSEAPAAAAIDEPPGAPAVAERLQDNHPIASELAALELSEFNLVLFLIASHHGKLRLSLQAAPADQRFPIEDTSLVGQGMPIRGVRDGDPLPAITLPDSAGGDVLVPELTLSLAPAALGLSPAYGPSWSERMLDLAATYSPFLLGYLEAVVRAADARASALPTADPRLAGVSLRAAVPPPAQAAAGITKPVAVNVSTASLPFDELDMETADV